MNFVKTVRQSFSKHGAQIVLVLSAALLLFSFVLGFFGPELFFRAYLVSFVFWVGMGLGSLAILMLHHLSGGAWGAALLRILEADARTLPWLTIIGLPLYLSIPTLFVWARPEAAANPLLQQKAAYLNQPFFIARTIAYFVIWNGLVWLMARLGRERDADPTPRNQNRLRRAGAIGLVVFGVTVTFAAIDWIMSLEPEWYSTIFAAMVAIGGILASFAFVILLFVILARRAPLNAVSSPQLLNDLGNLLLSFVMMWAYLAFSQYLLIWSGNLTEEIPWYIKRLNGGWEWYAVFIGLMYFVLPFVLLIIRQVKRHGRLLGVVALLLVLTRWLEVNWLIVPVFEPSPVFTLPDLLVTLGMSGVYLVLLKRELGKRPLLDPADSNLETAQEWAHKAETATRGV